MFKIIIFLDDQREPVFADGRTWVICRTAEACIDLLSLLPAEAIDAISLDHDLGTEKTGYEVAMWIEGAASNGRKTADYLFCHSANPVGRARIARSFTATARHLEPQ